MSRFSKSQVIPIVASVVAPAAVGLIALVVSSPQLRAQTADNNAAQTHSRPVLESRELPTFTAPSPMSLPNYAAVARTLRHWHQPVVTFHVTPNAKDKRTPAEEQALVEQGIDLWNAKIGSKVVLRMAKDSEMPDVDVSFAPRGSLGGSKVGDTEVSFSVPQNDIQYADMKIDEGQSDDKVVQTVAHECGHALGIEGHSDDKSDLMYPYAVHFPAEISTRDFDTIEIAYYQVDTTKKFRAFKRGQKFGKAKSY